MIINITIIINTAIAIAIGIIVTITIIVNVTTKRSRPAPERGLIMRMSFNKQPKAQSFLQKP